MSSAPQRIDFIVAGINKCGTTTLCSLLDNHPKVFFSTNKEPFFFSSDNYADHWPDYCALFDGARADQLCGEGSTFYSTHDLEVRSRDRILLHYPEVRLIFIVRNPLRRIESSYREFHHSGPYFGINDVPFDIGEALQRFPQLVEDSRYWTRLQNYRARVPDSRIHVVFLEDLKRDPAAVMAGCFRFLGLAPVAASGAKRQLNAGEDKLFDTPLLRKLRNAQWFGPRLARVPLARQDAVFRRIGLRRPFPPGHRIVWPADTLAWLMARIGDDAGQLLAHCGKPADFWFSTDT